MGATARRGEAPWLRDLLGLLVRGYQRPWLEALQRRPFTAVLGGRQLGKDRVFGGVGVGLDLAFSPGATWHCLSATQKHANDLMREIKRFTRLFLAASASQGYGAPEEVTDNVAEYELSNGSRVVSHAATPKSIQGARGAGGVLLNEIGAIKGGEEIFETAFSVVTGQLDQGRPSSMVVMGNAAHRGSFWQRLWDGVQDDPLWACVRATWSQCYRAWRGELGHRAAAVEAWLSQRRAERVRRLGQAAFLQWYECHWRSPEDSYFSPQLVEAQSYDPAEPPQGFPRLDDGAVRQTLGYDPARKSHPAGVCHTLLGGGQRWAWGPRRLEGERWGTWRAQVEELARLAGARHTLRVAVDETGPGDGPAELLEEQMGVRRVLRYTFSTPSRMALARSAKAGLESGIVHLPADNTDFLMEVSGLSTRYGADGIETLQIPMEGHRHGDMAVAWLLSDWAAAQGAAGEVVPAAPPARQGVRRFQ